MPESQQVGTVPLVVVVGGGFAGLAAAAELRKLGNHRVVILEAGDALGGRAATEKGSDDVGAGFFGRCQPDAWELVQRIVPPQDLIDFAAGFGPDPVAICVLHKKRASTPVNECFMQLQGLDRTSPALERALTVWGFAAYAFVGALCDTERPFSRTPFSATLDEVTFADFVKLVPIVPLWMRCLLNSAAKAVYSLDPNTTSLLFMAWTLRTNGGLSTMYNDQDGSPQQYGVRGGMGGLARRWAESDELAGVDVRFGFRATGIDLNSARDGITVTCIDDDGEEQRIAANHVVVATQPLALRNIRFQQALPPALAALSTPTTAGGVVVPGFAIKAMVTYTGPAWWHDTGNDGHVFAWLNCSIVPGVRRGGIEWILDCSDPLTPSEPRFAAFISPALFDGGDPDPQALHQRIADAIVELTGDVRAKNFLRMSVRDWRGVGGPNCHVAPGGMQYVEQVLGGVSPSPFVHFACADYASENTGYVSGAIQSGKRAAHAIAGQPPLPRHHDILDTLCHWLVVLCSFLILPAFLYFTGLSALAQKRRKQRLRCAAE
jgi:monoamine oxidase